MIKKYFSLFLVVLCAGILFSQNKKIFDDGFNWEEMGTGLDGIVMKMGYIKGLAEGEKSGGFKALKGFFKSFPEEKDIGKKLTEIVVAIANSGQRVTVGQIREAVDEYYRDYARYCL